MEQTRKIIDVHAHIIPGVDDGARSLEESCRMLCMAAEQGITAAIATPHYSRKRELKGLEELTERLQQEVRKHYPEFAIYQGQETYYHDGLTEHLLEGKAYTLAGSSYVLVEFDERAPFEEILRGIRALMNAGYLPVLAHMERYPALRGRGLMEELLRNGCLFQMNYDSLKGSGLKYMKEVSWCRRQVKEGHIHVGNGYAPHGLQTSGNRRSDAVAYRACGR